MYRHILVPIDGSKIALQAADHSITLGRLLGSQLTFVTVSETLTSLGDRQHAFAGAPETLRRQALEYLEAESRDVLGQSKQAAEAHGVAADTLLVDAVHPYEAIISTAKLIGADLIVMGSHGRSGLKAVLLGSVTQKVLTHTDLPVLVLR